ncbi:pyroglutamyl-peptidase 1 [Chironomus tepperi]|uniref:pyroglutamyl-peptidase 1 n=1 Tax=Chironomus tepperi TaxID=113505 RepID=UPI00391FBE58
MDEKLIVVTGYGVFKGHEEKNASWEAVQLLPNKLQIEDQNFKIEKIQLAVEYDDVDKKVNEIWSKNPELVIHVGVHGSACKIHLEKCARNGFVSKDFCCKTLCDPVICLENSGKCQKLETKIDVDKITKFLNEEHCNMFTASCDVGQYLCGYVYLKSLDKDPSRTLFVHVPCIDKPFSSQDTATGIFKVIEQCLITPRI